MNYSNRKCPRPSTAHKHDAHALTLETLHRVGNQLLYFPLGTAAAAAAETAAAKTHQTNDHCHHPVHTRDPNAKAL